MRRDLLTTGALAGLLLSGAAAAHDLGDEQPFAPGFHITLTFGGPRAATVAAPQLRDGAVALDAADTKDAKGDERSSDNWALVALVGAAAAIVVVSQHGRYNGNGGY